MDFNGRSSGGDIDQGGLLSASGSDFGTSAFWGTQGYFDVNFSNDQNDFAFEYAYLLDGDSMPVDAGTMRWDANAGEWRWSNEFTSTLPTPIGGIVWLLASGLLAVAGGDPALEAIALELAVRHAC